MLNGNLNHQTASAYDNDLMTTESLKSFKHTKTTIKTIVCTRTGLGRKPSKRPKVKKVEPPNSMGVRNPMKMSDIGFLKTEQNRTDLNIQKPKTQFPQFGFQKPTSAVWGRFSRCLIHNSSSNMIGSTAKVFFFMPYLCTSSSESLRLTISLV